MPPYLRQLPFFQVRKVIESRLELVVALVHFLVVNTNGRSINSGSVSQRSVQGRDQMACRA